MQAARRRTGTDLPLPAAGSVAGELVRWLRDRDLDVALTTLAAYRTVVHRYLIPHLGDHQLHTLDRHQIHDMYRHLLHHGNRTGGSLSAAMVRHIHRVLMKALKDLDIERPRVRQPRADKAEGGRKGVWTADQCARFLAHTINDRLYAAWALVVVCGLRRGELAGLKWPKIDLKGGAIHVHWQRSSASGVIAGGVVEKEPKGSSRRTIAIGPALVEILNLHRARQESEKAHAGWHYQDDGYVFCNGDGTPYHPRTFTERFRTLTAQTDLPEIALHDGRPHHPRHRPPNRHQPGKHHPQPRNLTFRRSGESSYSRRTVRTTRFAPSPSIPPHGRWRVGPARTAPSI
ncbi:tyrosine recombinase XerC [Phytohabitans flavus]|uniref:site-specific integrase n=1 Tax=Phytohabitans flavus TaxID=1076124 RepID=UPI003634C8D5